MPDTFIPPTAADTPTLYPPEPEPNHSPWLTWIPAAEYWNAAPTMLLPPPRPTAPVPIPDGIFLIPTDMLPPPMMESASRESPTISPPALVGLIAPARVSAAAAAPAPASAAAPVSAPAPLPLDAYTLEQCARLDAALALRPSDAPTLLASHQLDAATWTALRAHWQSALRASLRDGDPAFLRAYDAAFVAELERMRGPITPEQHAKLVNAKASARQVATFASLGLPSVATLAIERVMLQRACARTS